MLTETYIATASQTVFPFVFDLISASYLSITIDDVAETDWTRTGDQEITFGGSVALTGGEEVALNRSTPIAEPLVEFVSPSTLRAREINLAIRQLLHNLQEQDAQAASVLRETLAGGQWDAETFPLINLTDFDDAAAAATRGWVDTQIIASGSIPAPAIADAGRSLVVNTSGNYEVSDISNAVITFETPETPSTQVGQDGAFLSPFLAGGVLWDIPLTDPGQRIPFDTGSSTGTFFRTAPSRDANTFDIYLSEGVWDIMVKGSARNLGTYIGGTRQQSACVVQLTDLTGATLYDSSGTMNLGYVETALLNETQSCGFCLRHTITVASGTQGINVRTAHTNGDHVGIERPIKLFVQEIR